MRIIRLYGLARALMGYGDAQRAEARLHEAIHLASAIQDHASLCEAYASLGDLAQADGRLDLAMAAYAESHAHAGTALAPDALIAKALAHASGDTRSQTPLGERTRGGG